MFVELEKNKGDIMGAGMILWKQILKDTYRIGLIEGRHEMPVDEYIFETLPYEGSLADKIPQLQKKAEEWLENNQGNIDLYVTGMTPVLTAFLKAWRNVWGGRYRLMLYHYDISNKSYWAEEWK